ncbi:hypothetical protein [Streptomyces sp. NPDC058086]|uniref:hypothetical protein n=1 Tax=Streptomyces sp. NPDC058086 TaxID=3346334 RepID=UPI0036E4D1B9
MVRAGPQLGAGDNLERRRIVGRDAVVFPEVVAVADALLDPAIAQLVWLDSSAGRPRAPPAHGAFSQRLVRASKMPAHEEVIVGVDTFRQRAGLS